MQTSPRAPVMAAEAYRVDPLGRYPCSLSEKAPPKGREMLEDVGGISKHFPQYGCRRCRR